MALIDEIRVGDLNGDGRPDLVVRTHSNRIFIILTKGDGTLAAPVSAGPGTEVAIADLNGDGKLDLIIADSTTKRLIAAPGNGDGTFGTQVTTTLSIAPSEIETGDFDGDGRGEVLVLTTSAPAFVVFKAGSDLQFSSTTTVPLSPSVLKMVVGDFDADGKADVLVAYSSPAALTIHYGHGDGTFESGVPVAAPAAAIDDVTIGDLDADGRPDIVTCGTFANTVAVIRNTGNRRFAVPVSYDVHMFKNETYPYAVLVFDATDDGKPDVVVASGNYTGVMALPGNGDGSLLPPTLDRAFDTDIYPFVAADLTGDGKPDLVIGQGQSVELMRTAPGEVIVSVYPANPTLTPGQSESYTVGVRTAGTGEDGTVTPFATGTVTVSVDGTPVGTGTLKIAAATIAGGPLSFGSHQVTASYAGNAAYRATAAAPVTVNVVNEITTVTLTNDHDGQIVPFGTEYMLIGTVTSTVAGSLTGPATLYIDGQLSDESKAGFGPSYTWHPGPPPGTHTFFVKYGGDATHAPAQSNTLTQVVVKSDVAMSFYYLGLSANYGDLRTEGVNLYGKYGSQGGVPAGNVDVYEGQTLLLTLRVDGGGKSFTMPLLPPGVHTIYAVYEGDDRYNPGQSAPTEYTVLGTLPPPAPKKRAVHH